MIENSRTAPKWTWRWNLSLLRTLKLDTSIFKPVLYIRTRKKPYIWCFFWTLHLYAWLVLYWHLIRYQFNGTEFELKLEVKRPSGMLHLRSSEHADGGDSVEAVTAHQVWDVVLDLHFLTREASSLKQLSSGWVVVLEIKEIYSLA